jgi:hypothetical protein
MTTTVVQTVAVVMELERRGTKVKQLSEETLQRIVESRGRKEGSLWKFDALEISLLVNDIAIALLAAQEFESPPQAKVVGYVSCTVENGWHLDAKMNWEDLQYGRPLFIGERDTDVVIKANPYIPIPTEKG